MLDLRDFETVAGTTAGHKHRRGKLENNQDYVRVRLTRFLMTLLVGDGNSDAPDSHVGAQQQVRWLSGLAHDHARQGKAFDNTTWDRFARAIAERIETVAGWSDLPLEKEVEETWTSTVGGAIVTPEFTHLVAFGDLRVLLNGELIVFKAANTALNQPAAPSYLVVNSTLPASELCFKVITVPTVDVKSLVVATDGLDHLLAAVGRKYPGTDVVIPEPSYMWEGDDLFKPGGMANWLECLAKDVRKRGNPLAGGGKLGDDIAIGIARRKTSMEV